MSTYFPQEKINDVLKLVQKSTFSSFYRDRLSDYKLNEGVDYDKWQEIPLLEREEINKTPFWERVFVPQRDVPIIRHTYGSSGKRILVTPRSSYGNCTDPYIGMDMRRLMCFFASAHNEFPREEINIQVWFGDVGNLEMSAKIAAEAKIDSLSITPYTALVFAPILKKLDAVDTIRSVMIIGERCSPLQYKKICSLYPNAVVLGVFASSETREVVALPCVHDRKKGGSLILESIPEMYCEIVDFNTGNVVEEPGVPGELVITTLQKDIPFPLVRYKTGDVATRVPRACGCDTRSIGFEVLGRSSVLPIRLVKGELTINAIEQALAEIESVPSDYFELHYFEEESKDGIVLPRVHLKLLQIGNGVSTEEELIREIMSRLYVFPTYTYAQGVNDGIYLPMTLGVVDKVPSGPPGKPKPPMVFRHISDEKTGAKRQKREITRI